MRRHRLAQYGQALGGRNWLGPSINCLAHRAGFGLLVWKACPGLWRHAPVPAWYMLENAGGQAGEDGVGHDHMFENRRLLCAGRRLGSRPDPGKANERHL